MELNSNDIYNIVRNLGEKVRKNEKLLSSLDEKIGDGDFGININRAFDSIMNNINENMDINQIFNIAGKELMTKHGGTSGTLLGMAFSVYSKDTIERFDENEFLNFAGTLNNTIKRLGHASLGDKTMIDSLEPAYESANESMKKHDNFIKMARNVRNAAEHGMKSSINIAAKKGRSSYIGDRSIGHQDPGCTFIFYMYDAFYKHIENKNKV